MNLSHTQFEDNSAFASDLGIRPNSWPWYLHIVEANGHTSVYSKQREERDADGDITIVHYACPDGRKVKVFND